MKQYSYLCIGYDCQEVSGFLQAESDESARIKLMEKGLKIVRVDLCDVTETEVSPVDSESQAMEITNFESDPLADYGKPVWNTDTEYIDSSRSISQLQLKGLPLSASLRTLAEESTSRKLARTFRKMAGELEEGKTADDAFHQHLNEVPQNLSALIRMGVHSEKLESLVEDYIESQRLLKQSRHKIGLSLFYAVLLILGSFLLFYFLMTIVFSSYQTLFLDFGTELPRFTMLTINLADLLKHYGLQFLSILLISSLLVWYSFEFLKMRAVRRRMLNHIPGLGEILNNTSIAQFCRMLATLIDAEIKLPEALEMAARLTRDPNLIAGCDVLIRNTNQGLSLMQAAQDTAHFSRDFAHIFRWQDHPQIFVESLRASSNIFQARANQKTRALIYILQPFVLAGIMIVVGIPVLAIYLPLFKLLNDLS